MGITGQPIPPLDAPPTPEGAPPGITIGYDLLHRTDGLDGPWYKQRPVITPTVIVGHTNAATVEADSNSQINWANRSANNTHPHYAINHPIPYKLVPTNRRGIGNSTAASIETEYGVQDSSYWSIVIETADQGTNAAPTDHTGPLLDFPDDTLAEMCARAFAYEALAHNIPLEVPDVFGPEMAGVVTHTEPFPYPYFTTRRGKTCPTTPKKDRMLRGDVWERAHELHAAWSAQFAPQPKPEPTPEPEPAPEPVPVAPGGAMLLILDYLPGTASFRAFAFTGTHIAWMDGPVEFYVRDHATARVEVSTDELVSFVRSSEPTTPCPPNMPQKVRDAWTV